MRGDTGSALGQAHARIFCAEYGLHFRKDGDHWRCVEWPDLLMLRVERYRVGEREFAALTAALRHLRAAAKMHAAEVGPVNPLGAPG